MKFLICILEIIILFAINCFASEEDSKLLFVQILWRHGDRSPVTLYPTDPNSEIFWTEGLGKLTMLGRKQHYALGKFYREMYSNFSSFGPNEVKVIGSAADRCMKSAGTNLASFFAPDPEWKFDPHLDWQPIPIHYMPTSTDKYLEADSFCPKADEEEKRVLNSPGGQAFLAEHKKMYEYLSLKSGEDLANWDQAADLYDTLFIEKKYNLSIPTWVEPYWDELANVSNLSLYWTFNSPLLHRLRAGPILQLIIETLQKKLAGDIPSQKFQLYSAHDSQIAVILDSLNLFNMIAPPYCSSLIFELYNMSDGVNSLRILYQNSSSVETKILTPHVLVVEGCTEFCPLDYFINLTINLMVDDWEKECQIQLKLLETLKDKNVAICIIFALMAVIILTMSLFTLWKVYNRGRDRYSYHLISME